MTAPRRPVLRWHGGKWRLAPWIISHFPAHRIYVEPYGGAASVLLRKPRAYAEIYNDMNGEVVNLFRVLREPDSARRFIALLALTPFARAELVESYDLSPPDPVELARRLVVRSFQGFGSAGVNGNTTGFRANSNRSGTTPAHDWVNLPVAIAHAVERLAGVVIEQLPALELLARHDAPDALFYVDPPYLPETRSKKRGPKGMYHCYAHELDAGDHATLLKALLQLKGMVILSGYPAASYDKALAGWTRVERPAMAERAQARTEVLWINPAAGRHLPRELALAG